MDKSAFLRQNLICPSCYQPLNFNAEELPFCPVENKYYRYQNNIWFFQQVNQPGTVGFPGWKKILFPPDPTYLWRQKERIQDLLGRLSRDGFMLNLGSRDKSWGKRCLNLDLYPYPGVDVVADAQHLPFREECLELVIALALLEHLADPRQVIAEVNRVLRPGGYFYLEVPFLFGVHGDNYPDYRRWTISGLANECRPLTVIDSGIASGPASALTYLLRETISLLLSGGRPTWWYWRLRWLTGWLVFPLKYCDLLLNGKKLSINFAAGYYLLLKKTNP